MEYRFTSTRADKHIAHEFEAITLTDMCEAFQDFLKACGYEFDGKVDIVTEDNHES